MESTKKYKVVISDKAKEMLGVHIRFLANVDKKAAIAKKKEIISVLHSLMYMPNRFPFFEENYIPSNKYHKMYIEKWYITLYQSKRQLKHTYTKVSPFVMIKFII